MKKFLSKTGRKLLHWSLIGLVLHLLTAFLPVREAEMSSFINFSSQRAAVDFFGSGEFRFSGGVVPHGSATFLKPDKTRISEMELSLSIINKNKIINEISDFDAVGIKYGNDVYKLSIDDRLLYPLMKFVDRGTYTAFTIPPNYDSAYFSKNGLVKVKNGYWDTYIANEFVGHEAFLNNVDLYTAVERLPSEIEDKIIQEFDTKYANKELSKFNSGSYINADFHITYQVFLETLDSEKVANIAGLPLRYYYAVNSNNEPIIGEVNIFKFPKNENGLQYRSTIFFQAAAVLRYFKNENPAEFTRFMNEVAIAMGEK